MKRILTILVLISYSVASFGISLNYFYCCGNLESVSLVVKLKDDSPANNPKKGCCDNQTVSFKLKTDQKNTEQNILHFNVPISSVVLHTYNYNVAIQTANCSINFHYKSPPSGTLTDRNIRFCVFKI